MDMTPPPPAHAVSSDAVSTPPASVSAAPISAETIIARFRWILIGLALALGAGTLAELAILRHWSTFIQVIPWIVVVVSMLTTLLWAFIRTVPTMLLARVTALFSVLGSLFGIWEHLKANFTSAPFGTVWADTWDSLSPLQQVWEAASGGVDLTPPVAPGFAALCGICAFLSTLWWRPTTVPHTN